MFHGLKRRKYFSKNPKTQETHWKSTRSRPKIGCAYQCLKVPVGTLKSVDRHPARIRLVYPIFCFRTLFRFVMTSFFTQKIDCAIKFSKFCMNCQIGAFKQALSICFQKNQSPASLFSKRRRQEN